MTTSPLDSAVQTAPLAGTRDGLGIASLILGVAGFLPVPGVLGWISGAPTEDGGRRRTGAGTTGLVLGIVGVALFGTICFVYFVVLGYPLPQIHRYYPAP